MCCRFFSNIAVLCSFCHRNFAFSGFGSFSFLENNTVMVAMICLLSDREGLRFLSASRIVR